MGYLTIVAACFGCRQVFTCNPLRVPSYEGQPICRGCIDEVNRRRRLAGRPEWPVFPDSYEPLEDGEGLS